MSYLYETSCLGTERKGFVMGRYEIILKYFLNPNYFAAIIIVWKLSNIILNKYSNNTCI